MVWEVNDQAQRREREYPNVMKTPQAPKPETAAPGPPGSTTLSEAANQALCWLMGDQAIRMKCSEARAAILEGFGPKVDDELQAFFCQSNTQAHRSAPTAGVERKEKHEQT